MKFNIQKIDELKGQIRNIKEKITNSQKSQVPKKYYALLMLMLLLGVTTLSNNVKRYTQSRKEEYNEYEIDEKMADSDNVESINYEIAQSSISTEEPNMQEEAVEVMAENKDKSAKKEIEYIMPVDGDIIKEYATEKLVYSETLGMWKTHPGIDIAAKLGTKIKATASGKVIEITKDSFYGNTIKIADSNGYIFVYSNLDSDIDLNKGDEVKQGETIGVVGVSAAGELADKSHLHLEVIKDQIQVNPLDLIN